MTLAPLSGASDSLDPSRFAGPVEQGGSAASQDLQAVLDALSAQVCVLDQTGVVVGVNQAWRAFGQQHGARLGPVVLGNNYLAVCDQAAKTLTDADRAGLSPAAFAVQLRQVLAGTLAGFEANYACDTPQGRQWFLVRVTRMAGSQPPRTMVAHDNVTALQQALSGLHDGEALMLDMAASMPGAIFRLLQQPDGRWRFTYVSPGITALFGLTPEQVCADDGALGRQIIAEDRAAHDAVIRTAVLAGLAFEQEYRIHTTGGVRKWVHAQALPTGMTSGQAPGGPGRVWTGVLQDISERRHMETVLRSSEERYRTLFETVAQGVVYQDARGRITSANPAAQRILGRTLAQLQGHHQANPAWQALHEDGTVLPAHQHPSMVALRSGLPVTDVVMGVPVAGRGCVWLLVNATPVLRQGVVCEVYSSFEDITERVRLSQELKRQASTDDLTGVANRRSLMQRLAQELAQVKRPGAGHRCAVLAVDLDLFKLVNDQHGHAMGDAVLQQVATLMRRVTRQHDLVARSGGEEFTLLLPDTDTDDAVALAERLRSALRDQPLLQNGQPMVVTVSVGISLILPGDANLDAVLARADAALYQAKAGGRDQVRVAPLPALPQPG